LQSRRAGEFPAVRPQSDGIGSVSKEKSMELSPELKFGLPNGWVLLVFFYIVFGVLLMSFPKSVVARLYDRSGWTKTQRILSATGKLFILSWLFLMIFTPLVIGSAVFFLGVFLYALGLIGFVLALLNFRDTPPEQPVTRGLYQISRNPQQVSILVALFGISLAVGSWLAVLLIAIGAVVAHVRVLAEEQSCLEQYGASYESYMKRVPRYFVFF
jgi:protein-S-isoprenylcysteine O-methyltransferase Ste14